ncbi:reprolysin-like metallopeptidase [Flavobacterium sp. CS20]|uniref:zinc-dependent metalloprotease n=1 Tax=Flavobacterium sp. CS20 TaxID=2775246 RepID=UPI001B3A72F4|nr:zinc-dependent metalloprotease family protein [Flavobacterium sp. CS20]QTY27534.1 T9SS type A sorting domain-containing protein [Flavobacterium sp. CS20]
MHRKLLVTVLCLFAFNQINAQRSFWTPISQKEINLSQDEIINYDITVKQPSFFQLDRTSLSSQLNLAPNRNDTSASDIVIQIPNLKGDLESYEMFKVQTLSPQLAISYPKINSFVGKRSDQRDGSIIRITITPQGFYAMVMKPNVGQFFINPYDKDANYYISFLKSQAQDLTYPICELTESVGLTDENPSEAQNQTLVVDDSTLRTYQLALACSGEYAQFHVNQAGLGTAPQSQQITAVLVAMVVSVDRVNQIYERDLGVTLQLIPNNDQLIFLNPSTDPYTNNNGSLMVNENQTEIDATIGSGNYDIGHVFSTGGGGFAPGVVCVTSNKAKGVTGSPNPVGDPFDIDFVAHEMGHQFGANHTFNNSCGGSRYNPTAVEPGSGSTIILYAGICAPNVQNNSDAYFHQISIDEIFLNISGGSSSNCGVSTGLSNTAPTITPVPNYTIPNGTAFFLEASAVDAENDAMTYNWEQINNGISPSQPPLPTYTIGPNFRSLPSKTDSRRYFPNFNSVLNNNLTPTWEVVPSVARSMNFAVTVRDNNIQVGQSSREISSVNFANVGPFEVTSQNTADINWLHSETRTITWNVAGTTANGINTSNVNILLSTDGGQNFNNVLASNTANDGTEDITVPALQAPFCRIMIEPVDNIYYAINSIDFAIDTTVNTTCDNFINTTSVAIPDGVGPDQQGQVAQSVINIPNNITNIDDVSVTLDVSHTWMNDLVFQLVNPNGDFIILWGRNCSDENGFNIVFNDNGASIPAPGSTCTNPLIGTFSPVDTNTDLATIFGSVTQGNWVLLFADFYNGDTGTLNSWEIEICSTTFSVEDNSINGFTISPNPNQGIFNIRFNQPIAENSKISIYDFQGRLIENLDYSTGSIEQQIQLKNQYQSGVYLIEVSNENGKSVNKLIIK